MTFCFPEQNESFWMSGELARRFSSLNGKKIGDIVVVGGGISGLSIAFHLKSVHKNLSVILIEKSFLGSGASGRCGGIVVDHFSVYGSQEDSKYLRSFLKTNGLECDLAIGEDHPHEYLLDPCKLIHGLVQLCTEVGVEIFENSPVRNFSNFSRLLVGDMFEVCFETAIFASGNIAGLCSAEASIIQSSVQNCIVVEASEDIWQSWPWTYFEPSEGDADNYIWGRKLQNRRFLFGDYEIDEDNCAYSSIKARNGILTLFRKHLGKDEDLKVVNGWSGPVHSYRSGFRRVMRIDGERNKLFVGGYGGHGIAASVRSGEVITSFLNDGSYAEDFPVVTY
jgi:glycine/D-amino acid oxidase-like deaminating enzyme